MIFGNLKYVQNLSGLLPAEIYQILIKLQNGLFNDLPDGRHEYSGEDIYISASSYRTQPSSERRYEYHRRYADLQIIIDGEEKIYLASPDFQNISPSEDTGGTDCWFVDGITDESVITMHTGSFLLILPRQLHKPCCHNLKGTSVKKLVFKIDSALFSSSGSHLTTVSKQIK